MGEGEGGGNRILGRIQTYKFLLMLYFRSSTFRIQRRFSSPLFDVYWESLIIQLFYKVYS